MAAPAKRAREDGYGAGDGKNSGAAGAGAGAGASDDPSQASGAAHMSRHLKAIMDAADTFLQAHVRSPDTPREARAVVSAVQVTKLVDDTGGSLEEVLVAIATAAKMFAKGVVTISSFPVGACVRAEDGTVYCGANSEWPETALSTTMHGEQSAVHHAAQHGVTKLTHLAVNAPPCGYCRQFLNELGTAGDLDIIIVDPKTQRLVVDKLPRFLPYAFGPADLGRPAGVGMLNAALFEIGCSVVQDSLATGDTGAGSDAATDAVVSAVALSATRLSYSPYAYDPAGVGISFPDGAVVGGLMLENAAFDPTLCPTTAALNYAHLLGYDIATIASACVLQATGDSSGKHATHNNVSMIPRFKAILGAMAPEAKYTVVRAKVVGTEKRVAADGALTAAAERELKALRQGIA